MVEENIGSIEPDFSLKGKLAIITGASMGIGKEIARAFAAAGAEIIVTARTESKLIELKEEVEKDGGKCHFLVNDRGIYIPNWSIYGKQASVIKTFFPVAPLVVFVFGSSCWHEAMVGRTPARHNGVTSYYANFSLALYCWKIYCILVIFNSRTSSHIPHLDNC